MRIPPIHRGSILLLLAACGTDAPPTPGVGWEDVASMPAGSAGHGEVVATGALTVAPDGSLWIPRAPYDLFRADSVRGEWRRHTVRPEPDTSLLQSQQILQVAFFDARRAIATGHLDGGDGERGGLFRTEDGGRTWHAVTLPAAGWIRAAVATPGGEAWLGGEGGEVFRSADFGRTWELRSPPFDVGDGLTALWLDATGSGLAGAGESRLKRTDDGGRTWRELPTPAAQGLAGDPENLRDAITEALSYGGEWIVAQHGRVFRSPRDAVRWTPLEGGITGVALDRAKGTLFGLDSAGYLVRFRGFTPERISSRPMHAATVSLAAAGSAVYAADALGGIYRADGRRETFGYPLSPDVAVGAMETMAWDGTGIVGASGAQLYRSPDMGRTWSRIGWLPLPVLGLEAPREGEALVWDGRGESAWFHAATGRSEPVPTLAGHDVVDVVRTPRGWLAYGGMRHEAARRPELEEAFHPEEFAGSRAAGFVLSSRDGGRTWAPVDEWREGGVAALFPAADGSLTLLSHLGSVRRLEPSDGGYRATNVRIAAPGDSASAANVHRVRAVHFATAREGFVEGSLLHDGDRAFATADGGRTWTPREPSLAGIGLPLGDGRTVVAAPGRVTRVDEAGRPIQEVQGGGWMAELPPEHAALVRIASPPAILVLDGSRQRTVRTFPEGTWIAGVVRADDDRVLVALADGSYELVSLGDRATAP